MEGNEHKALVLQLCAPEAEGVAGNTWLGVAAALGGALGVGMVGPQRKLPLWMTRQALNTNPLCCSETVRARNRQIRGLGGGGGEELTL